MTRMRRRAHPRRYGGPVIDHALPAATPPTRVADAGAPERGARVTISDVAAAAGVSVSTVSKVINARYGVSAKTAEHVSRVVSELGFETSLVASSLRGGRTNVIGVLVAEFEPFALSLLQGISAELRGASYDLLAYAGRLTPSEQTGWERRSLSRLGGTLIDGAIIVTPTVESPNGAVPVVAIDRHTGRSPQRSISGDNRHGALQATRHLIELGHRRIAHIRGRIDLESALLREEGYRAALDEAGLAPEDALIVDGGYRPETTTAAITALLDLAHPPTAVFAANDLSALRALEVAHERGLRVPDDLSIVGFDDIPAATTSQPGLTTVHQPLLEMGRLAARRLIDELEGRAQPAPEAQDQLPTTLVVRGSTAPPRI